MIWAGPGVPSARQATSCSTYGAYCGNITDLCGDVVNCGSCSSPAACEAGVCQCQPVRPGARAAPPRPRAARMRA